MDWINFRHLYSFWMVNKKGGFKLASEAMFVSQSTVSEQVALLEDYFQKKLFNRTTRKLQLTRDGKLVFKQADEIFKRSREINKTILEGEKVISTLRVGIAGGVSRNLAFKVFSKAISEIGVENIDVSSGSFEELTRNCLDYNIDFFISTEPPYGKDLLSLDATVIKSSYLCLAGNFETIDLIESKKKPDSIDLFQFLYPYKSADIKIKLKRKLGLNFNTRLESNDISLLRFMANSELGVSLVPEIGVREDLKDNRLKSIPLKFLEKIQFYAIYPKVSASDYLIQELILNSTYKP